MSILDTIFGPGSILGRPVPDAPAPVLPPADLVKDGAHTWTWELRSHTLGTMVHLDLATGEMTFGENYAPDEAARLFWHTVSVMGGQR